MSTSPHSYRSRWFGVAIFLKIDVLGENDCQALFGIPLVPFCPEAIALIPARFSPGILVQVFGSRGLNGFLNYELLCCRIQEYFSTSISTAPEDDVEYIYEIMCEDDRHDLYQNLPYSMERLCRHHEKVIGIPAGSINAEVLLDGLIVKSLWTPRQ